MRLIPVNILRNARSSQMGSRKFFEIRKSSSQGVNPTGRGVYSPGIGPILLFVEYSRGMLDGCGTELNESDHACIERVPTGQSPRGPVSGERSPPTSVSVATMTLLSASDSDAGEEVAIRHRLRRAPVWGATCNCIAFMAVPRSVPACFAATGWWAGLMALLYSSIVTFDTGVVLGDVCANHPTLTSFPLLVGEASARIAGRHGCDTTRWRAGGELATGALQFGTYFLTAVAELIYFEQACSPHGPQQPTLPRSLPSTYTDWRDVVHGCASPNVGA
jgi:hypothetical protein